MGFSKVIEKITGILEEAKGIFSGLFAAVKRIKLPSIKLPVPKVRGPGFSQISQKLGSIFDGARDLIDRFLDRVPEEKRRPVLMGLGGLVGLFLVLLIAALALNSGKKQTRNRESSPSAMAARFTIPQEELYIPGEPDFIPEFLFEREPRRYWSLEDIRPFWRALEYDERWKEEISSAVDQLMEGVP